MTDSFIVGTKMLEKLKEHPGWEIEGTDFTECGPHVSGKINGMVVIHAPEMEPDTLLRICKQRSQPEIIVRPPNDKKRVYDFNLCFCQIPELYQKLHLHCSFCS